MRFLKSIRYPTGDFCDLSEIRPVNHRLTAHDSIFLIEEQGPFDPSQVTFSNFFRSSFRVSSSSDQAAAIALYHAKRFTSRQLVIRAAVPRRH